MSTLPTFARCYGPGRSVVSHQPVDQFGGVPQHRAVVPGHHVGSDVEPVPVDALHEFPRQEPVPVAEQHPGGHRRPHRQRTGRLGWCGRLFVLVVEEFLDEFLGGVVQHEFQWIHLGGGVPAVERVLQLTGMGVAGVCPPVPRVPRRGTGVCAWSTTSNSAEA